MSDISLVSDIKDKLRNSLVDWSLNLMGKFLEHILLDQKDLQFKNMDSHGTIKLLLGIGLLFDRSNKLDIYKLRSQISHLLLDNKDIFCKYSFCLGLILLFSQWIHIENWCIIVNFEDLTFILEGMSRRYLPLSLFNLDCKFWECKLYTLYLGQLFRIQGISGIFHLLWLYSGLCNQVLHKNMQYLFRPYHQFYIQDTASKSHLLIYIGVPFCKSVLYIKSRLLLIASKKSGTFHMIMFVQKSICFSHKVCSICYFSTFYCLNMSGKFIHLWSSRSSLW